MSRQSLLVATLAVSLWAGGLTVAQQPPPKEKEYFRVTGVKQGVQFNMCVVVNYYGVVEKIEGRTVTLSCHRGDMKPKSRTFEAIDQLADGGLLKEEAECSYAYLWTDMKKGDTVTVGTIRDEDEDKPYVVRLMIVGRVGGKVPPSQWPKGDERRLGELNILNDINNGLDVDDGEIAKWFPGKVIPGPCPPEPAGLNKEYQAKLDVIRKAKKEKDLKAAPQDKK